MFDPQTMKIERKSLPPVLLLLLTSSCGILGVHPDNVNRDPAYQAKRLAEVNNTPIALYMDSLIREIDSAPRVIPTDLHEKTLIVETFSNYSDFLLMGTDKFHKHPDNKKTRKQFEKYQKAKKTQIKDPKYTVVYIDKNEIDGKDKKQFRYVLKTTRKLSYDQNLVIDNDGHFYPYMSQLIYYIYDRETRAVFKGIEDLKILSKK